MEKSQPPAPARSDTPDSRRPGGRGLLQRGTLTPTVQEMRRARSFTAACVMLALVVGGLMLMPTHFIVNRPGTPFNVYGSGKSGDLVDVTSTRTYPVSGRLDLTTVYETNPEHRVTLFEAMGAWLDPSNQLVPFDAVYSRAETNASSAEQGRVDMVNSEQNAMIAVYKLLKVPHTLVPTVGSVEPNTPAAGVLKPIDQIVKIDGTPIAKPEQISAAVRSKPAGTELTVQVLRDGRPVTVKLKTYAATVGDQKVPRMGIVLALSARADPVVKVNLPQRIGGPSAGLVFAVAIYDRLTPGGLLGGLHGAGTGTIDIDGNVGMIGGIRQKIAGARNAGATFFLVPEVNCAEAAVRPPSGITLVKVAKLSDAIAAITKLRAGDTDVPRCTR